MMATTAKDFLSSKSWCYKMEAVVFKRSDIDGDGYISEEDRKSWQSRFMDYAQKQGVDITALEGNNAASEYLSTFGTGSERVSREDWLKKVAEIAAADLEKIKKGEEPVLLKNAAPFFDMMDTDKDGSISLEDFKLGYGSIGWDAVSAEYAFKALDKNNSGKIGREEIIESSRDFWYKIDPEPREGFTVEDFLTSKTWCYKMEEIVFKKTDIDGDGYISEEDRKTSESRFMDYAQKQNTDKKVLEANKAATESYISTFGTGTDRFSREDWLKRVAEIAAADQEKIKRGEEPLLPKTAGIFFDIMDSDKDGFVSLEDFKLGYVATGWDAVGAEQAFRAVDKNNSGRIGLEDMIKTAHEFWYNV
jgi:Ca2+-binding EF-hand superfamily protein